MVNLASVTPGNALDVVLDDRGQRSGIGDCRDP